MPLEVNKNKKMEPLGAGGGGAEESLPLASLRVDLGRASDATVGLPQTLFSKVSEDWHPLPVQPPRWASLTGPPHQAGEGSLS